LNFAKGTLGTVLYYAGFLLVLILCSEEFKRLVKYLWKVISRYPRLKVLCYPLAVVLIMAAAALIANSFITLFVTVLFSYD
jgi:hypothetical protein